LDSETSEDIMNLLTELNKTGMTVVLVTHEADIAAWARRKIVFKDGHIIEDVVQNNTVRAEPVEALRQAQGERGGELTA
jgi:putative ABC transport system ATP-binding protein